MKNKFLHPQGIRQKHLFLTLFLILLLSACGGGGDSTNPFDGQTSIYTNTAANTSTSLNELSIDLSYDLAANSEVAGFNVYNSQGTLACSNSNLQAMQTPDPYVLHISCVYNASSTDTTFTMTAFAVNGDESAHSAPFTANKAPVAVINAGWDDTTVHLDGNSSYDFNTGTIVSYLWDFGDGNTTTGSVVDHTFQPGTYTVRLDVVDNVGATTSTEVAITIS